MIDISWLGIHAPVWLVFLISFPIGALGTARLGRAVVNDQFPPFVWWREVWAKLTDNGPWNLLFNCLWCFPFWLGGFAFVWFIAGIFVPWLLVAWWIVWGFFALGYAASIIIRRDEPVDPFDQHDHDHQNEDQA